MGTTNVPQPTLGPLGYIAPAESAILTGVQEDFQAAFGGGLNFINPTTPQSQLSVSLTAIIGDSNDQFLSYVNNVDPAYSSGRMQDGIARIYFLTRNPALPTSVVCTCTGLPTTPIPAGALAEDTSGNTYFCESGGTIGAGGTVSLTFANAIPGPTPCPAGTLTTIVQAIPGWDAIDNPSDGSVGQVVESRADFELRREQSVAGNAVGTIGAIIGSIFANVPNVLDAYGYSNNTAGSVTIQGQTIAANAIYIAVAGGSSAAIAQAILLKKGPGAPMTGNTTVTAYDDNPLYSAPVAYSIIFEIPNNLTLLWLITITNSAAVPSNALSLIQAAVLSAFSGSDGGSRARIGQTNYASRYYGVIAALGAWAEVISIQLGTTKTAVLTTTGSIAAGTPNLTLTSGTGAAVGQAVVGPNVLPGTYIISGSGTSWVVNQSQTAASGAINLYAMNAATETTQINEMPAYNAANVMLLLQ